MAVLIFDDVGSSLMNHQEAKPFLPIRSRSVLPVPPNKAMQTDGRFAAAADRQGVRRCYAHPVNAAIRSEYLEHRET